MIRIPLLWCFTQAPLVQGASFDCSALKMTKCKPDREILELFLPKKDMNEKS